MQWLTVYEAINALWKEAKLIKAITIEEAFKLIEIIQEVIDYMKIISPRNYERQILELALKLNITAYDASYIILAKENNLVLVTEDKRLAEKASKIIRTMTLRDIA